MNTTRHFRCNRCRQQFAKLLLFLTDWNGLCPYCGFMYHTHEFDYNPNDPNDRAAHPELSR